MSHVSPLRLPLLVPRTYEYVSLGSQQWVPRSARAYTAADHASVANAREHHASLVYEVRVHIGTQACYSDSELCASDWGGL